MTKQSSKPDTPEYSPTEKASLQSYKAALYAGRYFKQYDSSTPFARIVSGDDPMPLPLAFLCDDFKAYCREHRLIYPKDNPPSAEYLGSSLRLVTGYKFVPNGPDLLRANRSRHCYMNTYKRFEPEHPAIELSPLFLDFLRRLFPVPEELHTFCQYIAHAIQQPEERPSWHIMLPSEQGVGKGFLFNAILTPLFSGQTVAVKTFSALTGQFGATIFEQSMFTLMDDCKTGSESTQTQMKSLMSEERIYIEHKGKQGAMRDVFTRLMLASNEDVPAPVDGQTRRWWIPHKLGYCDGLKEKAGQQDRQRRIKALSEWLQEPGALEAVFNYFKTYQLDGFDPKDVPITASFERMVAKSETPEQAFAADWLELHPLKVFKLEELGVAFIKAGMGKQGNGDISDMLVHCGYQKDILATPTRGRWWFPVSMSKRDAEALMTATEAEKAEQPAF
ncbi:primase-helicase family protein [Duganella sp. HH101]|uniref:primase-helicase family protein n=1 Tax=Duganella sp. HH101 TaxID=1781066 RepID=UPI000874C8A0|nr:primase-helicase family protein [Duganella sp. HH101]OFA04830.1 hypothetical protein DUGA2_15730 [Duganella sp. HH101]